jgi:DMSO reductase anchor subunit
VTTVVAAFGVVACSMMVYAVTGRAYWSVPRTFVRFFSSAAVSGLAMALAVAATVSSAGGALVVPLALALVLAAAYKLSHEAGIFRELSPESPADLRRTAKILLGPLKVWTAARAAAGATGGVLLPLLVALLAGNGATGAVVMAFALLGWVLVLAGEYLERELFFRAASAPRMPGGVAR